uniref:Uncharacterized protein n=1 Tax=Anguilla anguilla TaxID=7936 RepID=A0A0E9VWE3_ANGAN
MQVCIGFVYCWFYDLNKV